VRNDPLFAAEFRADGWGSLAAASLFFLLETSRDSGLFPQKPVKLLSFRGCELFLLAFLSNIHM
jgi:hypothetical protein